MCERKSVDEKGMNETDTVMCVHLSISEWMCEVNQNNVAIE